MNTTTIAGIVAGIAGLLLFLLIHHFTIAPIWFILPMGLIIAGLGGAAVGQAYQQLLPHLPTQPWTAVAIAGLVLITLLPAAVLAELRPPMFDMAAPNPRLMMGTGQAVIVFILELLVTTTIMGGLVGWFISHTRSGAISMAIAGFVFALGPGHNIPFLGNTPASAKGFLLLAATVLAAALVLDEK